MAMRATRIGALRCALRNDGADRLEYRRAAVRRSGGRVKWRLPYFAPLAVIHVPNHDFYFFLLRPSAA